MRRQTKALKRLRAERHFEENLTFKCFEMLANYKDRKILKVIKQSKADNFRGSYLLR